MGTNECSQLASKSSWDGQDFGDVNMVLKMAQSSRPQWVNPHVNKPTLPSILSQSENFKMAKNPIKN